MSDAIVLAILLSIVMDELRAYAQANGVPTATAWLLFVVRRRFAIIKDNRARRRKMRRK